MEPEAIAVSTVVSFAFTITVHELVRGSVSVSQMNVIHVDEQAS